MAGTDNGVDGFLLTGAEPVEAENLTQDRTNRAAHRIALFRGSTLSRHSHTTSP